MRSLDQFKSLSKSVSEGPPRTFAYSLRPPESTLLGSLANLKLTAEKLVKEQASVKTDLEMALWLGILFMKNILSVGVLMDPFSISLLGMRLPRLKLLMHTMTVCGISNGTLLAMFFAACAIGVWELACLSLHVENLSVKGIPYWMAPKVSLSKLTSLALRPHVVESCYLSEYQVWEYLVKCCLKSH